MTDPLAVRIRPEQHARTPEKACVWVAEATVDGIPYTARSRYGAVHELSRVLVAAAVPDAPLQVIDARLKGHLGYRSFHAAALYTIEENARGLRRIPYARVVAARERLRRGVVEGPKPRVSDASGSTGAPEAPEAANVQNHVPEAAE